MTIRELEKQALIQMQQAFHEERKQVLINEISELLCFALELTKEKLFIIKEQDLSEQQIKNFSSLLERRLKKEPLAYLIGEQEFFSLNFKVSPDVLIPRPETELLVEQAINVLSEDRGFQSVVDIGSGSGAIIVSIAKQTKTLSYYALDLSPAACRITSENAQRHQVKINVLESDLLSNLPVELKLPALFVSNPPYIPESEQLMSDVQDYEPKLALRAGNDGLSVIKCLLEDFQMQVLKNPRSILLMEIGIGQHLDVKSAALQLNLELLDTYLDFQGIARVIKIGKKI